MRRVVILLLIFLGALPLLRLRGAYFAIATWLIAESVSTVFNGWNVAGAGGGMQIKTEVTQLQLYYVALGLLAVTTAIERAIPRRTRVTSVTPNDSTAHQYRTRGNFAAPPTKKNPQPHCDI